MNEDIKITVYSRIYNTPSDMLRRCIESVLNQTFRNFEYLLCDNGSTDGSQKIMEEYRDKDPRIRYLRCENNHELDWMAYSGVNATGKYVTMLDSDDWFEPEFLEKTLAFAEEFQLDIACAGSHFISEKGELIRDRSISQPMILTSGQFAEQYPYYHAFFRTGWNKLFSAVLWKSHCCHRAPTDLNSYGGDTFFCFLCLRDAARIGITNKVLYNYTIREKSSSYIYDHNRFDSDVYLYNDAVDFLSAYGPISAQNRKFITVVYANAINDTVNVIANSSLTPAEKIGEYRRIAVHPITISAYRWQDAAVKNSRKVLLILVCNTALQLVKSESDENFQAAIQALCPKCGIAVIRETLPLFVNKALQESLLQDDRDILEENLLKMIVNSKNDLSVKALQRLALDKPMLFWIEDSNFLRFYSSIYWSVWQGHYEAALNEMAGLALNGKVKSAQDTFYQLFINLAAQLGEGNAFIFGKIELAWIYLSQDRLEQCAELVTELEEMGLAEEDQVAELRQTLKDAIRNQH